MSTAAFKGVAWYVWTRHGRQLIGVALIYLMMSIAYDPLWVREGKPFINPMLAFMHLAPFVVPLLVLTSAVSIATVDLATGESWYPKHFFRLPLTTHQLAMPFAVYTVGLYLLLHAAGIVISHGRVLYAGPLDMPVAQLQRQDWDALLRLAVLVWIQALIWTPFARRWSRLALLFVLLGAYFAALLFALRSSVPGYLLVTASIAQVPLAYVVATRGIAQARRGDTWLAGVIQPRASRVLARRRSEQQPFSSGLAAQQWFEATVQRTRAGFLTTFLIPFILFFTLLVNLFTGRGTAQTTLIAQQSLILMVFILGVVALSSGPGFAAFNVGVNSFKGEAFRMPSFFGALPLATGQFAWAKLRTAARRMAFVAAIVLLGAVLILVLAGMNQPAPLLAMLRARYGEVEVALLLAFGAGAFLAFTAAATANVVWVALIGRGWNVISFALAIVFLQVLILPSWIVANPGRLANALRLAPTVLPIIAAVKISALAILTYRAGARGFYTWSRLAWIAVVWLGTVAVCVTVYSRYVPDGIASLGTVLSTVIILMPVLGIVGAPLALHLNRCR